VKRILFCLGVLGCGLALAAQSQSLTYERGSFEIVATSSSRSTLVRVFFNEPFKSIPPQGACTIEIWKDGRGNPHGAAEVKNSTVMWVEIYAENGEKINWSCRGLR